jgi:SAM-dependent methyltransferase
MAALVPAPDRWWADEDFWEEMFEFIFPPELLALGEELAVKAVALAGAPAGASIVDLGCGPGRVCVPLARRGYSVTGVDLHAGLLARARAWAEREAVQVELVRADISEVRLGRAFDAALCLFNSFGYFAAPARDARVIARAAEALRPGGAFVLEAAHRDGVVRTMHVRERVDGDRRWLEVPRFDPVTGILESRWTVTEGDRERTFTWRSRPYAASELSEMLRGAGFHRIRFHSDFDGSPPSLDRYMIVAVGEKEA